MRFKRLPKTHIPVDKSVLRFGAGKRDEDPEHLEWIRKLPCWVTNITGKTEAAHIRKGTDGKAGGKPSDKWSVPLSATQHRIQHNSGEISYWKPYGGVVRAKKLSADLHSISGNTLEAYILLREFRRGFVQ